MANEALLQRKALLERKRDLLLRKQALQSQATPQAQPEEPQVLGLTESERAANRKALGDTAQGIFNTATFPLRPVANLTAKTVYGRKEDVIPEGSGLGQLIGAILPQGMGSRLASTAISKLPKVVQTGKNIVSMAQRGAAGAAAGAQVFDYPNIESRVAGTGAAALGGATLAPVATLAPKAPKMLRDLVRKQVRSTRKLTNPPPKTYEQRLSGRQMQIKDAESQAVEGIKTKLKTDTELAERAFQESAETGSLTAQNELKTAFGAGKKSYEEGLDIIADRIDKSKNPFTKKELREAIDETMEEVRELFIEEGGAPEKVLNQIKEKFLPKYTPKYLRGDVKPTFSDRGAGMKELPENVSLKEVLGAKKAVDRAITASAKSGVKGFTSDDIVSAIFNKNIGSKISAKDKAMGVAEDATMKALQGSYGTMAERMKDAYRIFKIGKGEKFTKTGTEMLKRVATGKAEAGEVRAIEGLIKGDKLAPQISDITRGPKEAVKKLSDIETSGEMAIKGTKETAEQSLRRLTTKKYGSNKREELLRKKEGRKKIVKRTAVGLSALGGLDAIRRMIGL